MSDIINEQRDYSKQKFNSKQMEVVLEQITKNNLSLNDIELAIGLFEKLSTILVELNVPLPPISATTNSCETSNESILHNQLQRLRASSIAFLHCKRKAPLEKHNRRRVKKRPLETNYSKMWDEKRRNISDDTDVNLVVQRNVSCGFGMLDICYICKKHCTSNVLRHKFYQWMCIKCGDINYKKRNQTADLNGKVALVTGGRIKIGFEIVLKLLRCGASVILTTRFPNDARRRYESQEDFRVWSTRLYIYKLDLRFIPEVEGFCKIVLTNFKKLDILIQNAAQTIRRPVAYYRSLLDIEKNAESLTSTQKFEMNEESDMQICTRELAICSHTSQLLVHPEDFKYANDPLLSQQHFPVGLTDQDGDQLDLRPKNTWIAALNEVETHEMVEVTLANYMSPYIILKNLTSLMAKERNAQSLNWGFIVLVSAMEGKFTKCHKTGKHPHTNAAKAAINMLVKTSAAHYKKMGILMNAVDTGWVTDEHPVDYKSRLISGLKTPLDTIDGAARVLDPILRNDNHTEFPLFGKFLKDYRVTDW